MGCTKLLRATGAATAKTAKEGQSEESGCRCSFKSGGQGWRQCVSKTGGSDPGVLRHGEKGTMGKTEQAGPAGPGGRAEAQGEGGRMLLHSPEVGASLCRFMD